MSATPNGPTSPRQKLKIWQQNLNKSLTAQSDFIHRLQSYDIALVQEPFIDWQGYSRAMPKWTMVYPPGSLANRKATRSLIMVSSQIKSDEWRVLPLESPDVTAIELVGTYGTLRIFNWYVAGNSNRTIHTVRDFLQRFPRAQCRRQPAYDLVAGDTNRHHPMWELLNNHHLFTRRNMELAQPLIEFITRQGLDMPLPAEIPTLEAMNTKNLTRPDNVFCSSGLTPRFVVCKVDRASQPPKTDHFPVIMQLDLEVRRVHVPVTKNYRQVDWEKFREVLQDKLSRIPPPAEIEDERDFYEAWTNFDNAVKDAVGEVVPDTKITPYNKRWWNEELAQMKRRLNVLGRMWCGGQCARSTLSTSSGDECGMTMRRQ